MRASFAVGVFCGSRFGASPRFGEAARDLGRGIAERGWTLVYGGGDVGLMGVVADAAKAAGGHVTGIIPERLMAREVGKRNIDELVVTPTMFARKELMIGRSHAFVTLPGGLGTLDELLEVVTLKQLGYVTAPVILLSLDGFWRAAEALLDDIVATGFAEPSARGLVTSCPDVATTLETLAVAARDLGPAPA